ncbi:MAG TPA: hypothetical protein VN886_19265 [Acidimicrobiales bacterium]|nr:hypothetical protein [Acidimicrobiales bacterium]
MDCRRLMAIAFVLMTSLSTTGCDLFSSAKTLDKPSDVDPFIEDIAHGSAGGWSLPSHAAEAAKRVWEHKEALSEITEKLDEVPDRGCKVLDQAASGPVEEAAITEEREGNLREGEALEVIANIKELEDSEIVALAHDICGLAKTE